MASATHLIPTSPLSVIVPNPRRGICRPLLRVTSGIKFFWVLVFGAANDCALPRLRNMAEAAHSALVCKNWLRLIPLELRSLVILHGCHGMMDRRVAQRGCRGSTVWQARST